VSAAPKERPVATDGDAIADITWFSTEANRGRRYRLRPVPTGGFWLIRRRGGNTFLRAWTASPPPGLVDTDDCLRQTWFATAWPGVNPKTLHKLIKTARQNERNTRGPAITAASPAIRRAEQQTDDIDGGGRR
jgi:hypothetical protein